MNPLFSWHYLWGLVRFHCVPREQLIARLNRLLSRGDLHFHPAFSGRCALRQLGAEFRSRFGCQTAFVPDYICNVVHVALSDAGLTVETYATDDQLEPKREEIVRLLNRRSNAVLLTASIFGSSAFLDDLGRAEIDEVLKRNNWTIIVDACQDVGILGSLPAHPGERIGAVVSFNDKSFPGMLGGGYLCSFETDEQPMAVSPGQALFLYYSFVRKCFRAAVLSAARKVQPDFAMAPRRAQAEFDWSVPGSPFPYSTDPFRITRLQAILGILGLTHHSTLLRYRRRTLDRIPKYVPTRHCASAPFLLIPGAAADARPIRRYLKRPYAVAASPSISTRPAYLAMHHKGFFDEQR